MRDFLESLTPLAIGAGFAVVIGWLTVKFGGGSGGMGG